MVMSVTSATWHASFTLYVAEVWKFAPVMVRSSRPVALIETGDTTEICGAGTPATKTALSRAEVWTAPSAPTKTTRMRYLLTAAGASPAVTVARMVVPERTSTLARL